jgi:outer membrane protein TolC
VDSGKIESSDFIIPGVVTNSLKFQGDQSWNADLQVVQPIYAGGRLRSAHRQSKLTLEAALAAYRTTVADALLQVRIAYHDLLLAGENIVVNEASIVLLEKELTDTRRRFDAGTAPRFNVLRAEVELANAKPRLFRARNAQRTARNQLATLMGFDVPKEAGLEIPLEVTGKLALTTHEVALMDAIQKALAQRSELRSLRAASSIRDEEIVQARAGYYPNLGLFAGYGWQNRNFPYALDQSVDGWSAGAQMSWDIWDFGTTKGKVDAAKARKQRTRIDSEDTSRQIVFQVRTAHSNFLEAKEVLDSQARVIEQAEEALRLATARADAGSGTQLDVLSAQTALTEARSTYAQALRDHAVAWDRLQRAIGEGVAVTR